MTFFSAWIMVITTIQWIMMDMYLPALPVLAEEFQTTESMLNMSLNSELLMTAVGTLVSGVISDRFGRKPILLAGFGINIAGSLLCACAKGVTFLILMRGLQGLGSGFVITITTAIIKDSLTGSRFQRTMTVIQSIGAVGPIFAPAIGALLINFFSWRAIFLCLGIATLITMLPMIISDETWPEASRKDIRMGQVLEGAVDLGRNKSFMLFLTIMSVLAIPVWAYIGVSSYVYINEFGLGNVTYGVFYSTGSFMSCLAPFVYLLLVKFLKVRKVVSVSISLMAVGGCLILTGGSFSPVIFMLGVLPVMMSEGIIRPLGYVVLLEEFKENVGTTSSWVHFVLNMVGVIGTSVATLKWPSMVMGIWVIALTCTLIALICWVIIRKQGLLRSSLNQ